MMDSDTENTYLEDEEEEEIDFEQHVAETLKGYMDVLDNMWNDDDNVSVSTKSIATTQMTAIDCWRDRLTDDEFEEMETYVSDLIDDYLQTEIIQMSKPDFHDIMVRDLSELAYDHLCDVGICQPDDEDEVEEVVSEMCVNYFESVSDVIPKRSSGPTTVSSSSLSEIELETLRNKIQELQNVYQPKQKTPEWYEFRSNLLTASNIWKALSSEAQQNSLIYEKCKPHEVYGTGNVNSSLHWGVKYEPVTVQIYEDMYQTKVGDFGCIVHPMYSFIGASPDGINILETSPRYGRMLEIKNIVNREINGIPKEEYWVQMQVQMETCDLDECDFMETRIKEVTASEFHDSVPEQSEEDTPETPSYKGVILWFNKKVTDLAHIDYTPYYIYSPIGMDLSPESIESWKQEKKMEMREEYTHHDTIYWKLDEMSCVLVKRNKLWFDAAVPQIQKLWKTVEYEKVNGYDHRMPKKKVVPRVEVMHDSFDHQIIYNMPTMHGLSVVKIGEQSWDCPNSEKSNISSMNL